MLSLSFIREHPEVVREGARKKGETSPVDEMVPYPTANPWRVARTHVVPGGTAIVTSFCATARALT